ncbi:MAG: 16S rRNA (cytidine(1402)-2'-O)-methyltransferase, partial [Methylobacterium sp.]|nr:16S rRNA (cytidine(1402)-2'-O)-methyltransferase [Methylobacterium sp.]
MSHSGTLYVVATPIGNLQDITLRALETLKTVDLVAAEDTRHTARLLTHFGLQKKTMALHEHNERRAGEQVIRALQSGRNVALVTDAGTPGISDPGAVLVDMAHAAGVTVVPLPGPCAAATALSAGGLVQPHFLFYGFLPAAGGQRRNAIESLRELAATLVFYEAPHRILDSVADLAELLGPARTIVFARELTKTFETIHRTTLGAAAEWLQADANRRRGEFVLLVEGRAPQA